MTTLPRDYIVQDILLGKLLEHVCTVETDYCAWYNSLGKLNTVQNLQHKDKPFAHVFVVFNAVEQKAA